jgi:uncharacterized protein (DUF2249 family)
MTDLLIASSADDARAVDAVEAHHAEMAGALHLKVSAVLAAARAGDVPAWVAARDDLAGWCTTELVPHARGEEETLYPAASGMTEGRLLVEGMVGEHGVIVRLVEEVSTASDPVAGTASAVALREIFDAHLAKENDLLLPLLAAAPDVSVAGLLDGMHEILGGAAAEGQDGHSCGCHESDDAGWPELDARVIPHAIRHATVFGATDSVPPGAAMVLIAPHDPLPLLAQLEQRSGGAFEVSYLERGPEAWRLLLTRRG